MLPVKLKPTQLIFSFYAPEKSGQQARIVAPAVNPELVTTCRAEIATAGPVEVSGLTGLLCVTTVAPASVLR